MFDKILVANRGEIACRVMRTARRLGIGCVAVYSDADADAMHVAMADEAIHIGPAPAADSYLRIDAVIEAARASGASAVHPGYGFLSENAEFAEACAREGIVFVGPSAETIRKFGSKSTAKRLMEDAGVPVVPGYHDDVQSVAVLREAAADAGYPVLIKAVAGGGGKGMRRVDQPEDFEAALAGAQREGAASFGNDQVLIEKFVLRPRHIEVQVFGDSYGNVVHLFDRDCSVQRRHQKVLEEAPAPGLSDDVRQAIGAAAVQAAKAVKYVNAGTVEFISSGGDDFYFMEVNTRLQVEHPVTELVTGYDLVDWQLRIAAGETLPVSQDEVSVAGHALEARIYAEDPANNFLPSTGRLTHVKWPADDGEAVRIDTGVRQGDTVSPFYDPMICKLVVWGNDRDAALRRMKQALVDLEIGGPATNGDFLGRVVGHEAFADGSFDTGFIETYSADVLPEKGPTPDDAVACFVLAEEAGRSMQEAAPNPAHDPWSPWNLTNGWRLNYFTYRYVDFEDTGGARTVKLHYGADGYTVEIDGRSIDAQVDEDEGGALDVRLDGRRLNVRVVADGAKRSVFIGGLRHDLSLVDPLVDVGDLGGDDDRLTAPMSGKVIKVNVENGANVTRGTPLLILEAMKMEHTISAPADGTVTQMLYRVGDQVDEGARLVEFEHEEEEADA
jgi:3-methylcrotonyl-CoA carboxylase alpha subunit